MLNKLVYLVLADTLNGRRNYLPYQLLYLGNSLKNAGFEVVVKHCVEKEFNSVVKEILIKKPILVGLSVLTGPHISYALRISRGIKRANPSIPICWGEIIHLYLANSA